MSHDRAFRHLRAAAEAMQEAEGAFEPGDGEPDENERAQLARALYLIHVQATLLRQRYGINPDLMQDRFAPDWQTRQEQAHALTGRALTVAMNYRPNTEHGPSLAASRRAIEALREALQAFQRAQREAIAG